MPFVYDIFLQMYTDMYEYVLLTLHKAYYAHPVSELPNIVTGLQLTSVQIGKARIHGNKTLSVLYASRKKSIAVAKRFVPWLK